MSSRTASGRQDSFTREYSRFNDDHIAAALGPGRRQRGRQVDVRSIVSGPARHQTPDADSSPRNQPRGPGEGRLRQPISILRLGEDLLDQGVSFCLDTVFSHESKIDFVARAKALGYKTSPCLHPSGIPALNEARVHQRVAEAVTPCATEKTHTRIPVSMKHIAAVLPLVDETQLKQSSRKNPYRQVAVVETGAGARVKALDPLPIGRRRSSGTSPDAFEMDGGKRNYEIVKGAKGEREGY